MSRSIRRVDANSQAALADPGARRVAGKRRVYDVTTDGYVIWHHEKMFDAASELIYDHPVPMHYVVGSGRRAKAYVHQRGNLLFMSPLNWYTQSEQWDVAPGYTPDDPRRFSRRVTDDCLSCHAGRVAEMGRSLNRYQDPPFHEISIGCENCHGPGGRHIAFHSSAGTDGPFTDRIVNPARLEHAERDAVCFQCHLQGAVRLPRYGRSDFDFRPGQRLDEVWAVLVAGSGVTQDGRTKSVSHVQQMRESRCYTESQGRLACISCHDPHSVPSAGKRQAYFRDKCFQCHDNQACVLPHPKRLQEENNSCIACHMPRREASNVSHVTQTDHRVIRAAGPARDRAGDESDSLSLFGETRQQMEPWQRQRALGLGSWLHLSNTERRPPESLAQLLRGVLEVVPQDGDVLTVLGSMALDKQSLKQARRYYQQAVEIPHSEEAALSALMKIHYISADFEKALTCADRLLEIDRGHARTHAIRADALKAMGRHAEAIESAERALNWNPTLMPVRQWLIEAYRRAGRTEQMQRQEQILRRMQNARPPG